MPEIFYRKEALELVANNLLKNYKFGKYLNGTPQAVPIEAIVEMEYGLNIEYLSLRKSGKVLGQTVFEDCLVPFYDKKLGIYNVVKAQAGTIFIDDSLLAPEMEGRLRYTLAHELAHWLLHQKIYGNTSQAAAKISESFDSGMEWQADTLAAAILLPKKQVKRAFYSMDGEKIEALAELFCVSHQAMRICLKSHNLV